MASGVYPAAALLLTPAGILCWSIVLKVLRGVWGVLCVGGGALESFGYQYLSILICWP